MMIVAFSPIALGLAGFARSRLFSSLFQQRGRLGWLRSEGFGWWKGEYGGMGAFQANVL